MNNKTNKLKKLNIKHGKVFLKNPELVSLMVNSAAVGTAVGAVGAAAFSALGTVFEGANLGESMFLGGVSSLGSSSLANMFKQRAVLSTIAKDEQQDLSDIYYTQKQATALFTAVVAATALSTGLGVGVGAGTHKLTTAIINKLKPDHQIEQTVEVEPMPVIDEIQVEK